MRKEDSMILHHAEMFVCLLRWMFCVKWMDCELVLSLRWSFIFGIDCCCRIRAFDPSISGVGVTVVNNCGEPGEPSKDSSLQSDDEDADNEPGLWSLYLFCLGTAANRQIAKNIKNLLG